MPRAEWKVESPEDRVKVLERASKNRTLKALISPVVAASFGVIPVRRKRGEVTLATFPQANRDAVALLGEVLEAKLEPIPFEEALMGHFLSKMYLKNGGVNFQTFQEADFLRKENLTALTQEKKESIRGRCHLPKDKLILCDISFRSLLTNLDRQEEQLEYELGSTNPAFRRTSSKIFVDPSISFTKETLLLLRESYSYRGVEFKNGFRGAAVEKLPHTIHPSEIQIASIGSGGEVTFYIYDRLETVEPEQQRTWQICYHFLSFGNRYCRQLALRLHNHRSWPRKAVTRLKGDPPLRPKDLRRWFGYDWEEDWNSAARPSHPRG